MTARRQLLAGFGALVAGAVLPGCTTEPGPTTATRSTAPTATTPAPPTGTPSPTAPTATPTATPLPEPPPWRPSNRDSDPAAKELAAQVLTVTGTWDPGAESTAPQRLRALPVDLRARRALAASGLDRGAPRAAAGVLEAQMGGLLAGSASVMVVLDQQTDTGMRQRTFDVRLRRDQEGTGSGGAWVVSDVIPAAPDVAQPAALSRTARAALREPRLRLPTDAAADVASGTVDDDLLALLLELAAKHTLDVTVLRSGHPYLIFDKPRVSDHSVGRAADIWAVDGNPVVDLAAARTLAFIRRAADLGAYQIGSPIDPGPPSAPYYTDAVHEDHVHLGVA